MERFCGDGMGILLDKMKQRVYTFIIGPTKIPTERTRRAVSLQKEFANGWNAKGETKPLCSV